MWKLKNKGLKKPFYFFFFGVFMFKKIFIISFMLILLIFIPQTFALDTHDNLTSNDYYFNSSNSDDGDGSLNNPYRDLEGNIKAYSENYLANGEYNLENVLISDVSFIGEDCEKTVINCHGHTLNITKSLKLKNIILTDFTIINLGSLTAENTIFQYGYGLGIDKYGNSRGGAIYSPYNPSKTYTVTLKNTTFKNNYDEYGGAIYMDGGVLKITNSKFIDNMAYNYGGSIACEYETLLEINRSDFINSKSVNDAGGAIYLKLSNLTLNRVNIINSSSTFGAAITALDSNLYLTRLNAYNNHAKYDGGAIYQIYGKNTIQNSNFINNTANNGGAIFLDNLTSHLIISNTFTNNTAACCGGAIYSLFNTRITTRNTFSKNNALIDPNLYESSQITINTSDYTIYINNNTFSGDIPAYYNLKDHNLTTPVKTQQYGGNCWAFASIAALESCILKASGVALDLSEENMKNLAEKYSDYGWFLETNEGGYNNMAIGYLTSWLGPVFEINDTYDDFSTLSQVFNSLTHIQNVVFLKRDNYTDNDEIKRAILTYGGVATGICYYDEYLNNLSYYCYKIFDYPNHAVTIVGWDDTYSKDNFWGNPDIDGAWIVKNSWGESWGDDGYFYVSYCDRKLAQVGVAESAYTFAFTDPLKYDKNYQYDFAGKTNYFSSNEGKIYYQNIFKAGDDEILAAVSTHFEKTCNWTFTVYVNDELKLTQSGVSSSGYYTIHLDKLISLKKDDEFKIIFKIGGNGSYRIPICEKSYSDKFISSKGVSFFSYDGEEWFDLYTSSAPSVASLKAFTLLSKVKCNLTVNITDNQFNPVEISVKIVDEYGYNVQSGNVSFKIENHTITIGVVNGSASLKHNFTKGGLLNVSVSFKSDIYEDAFHQEFFNVNITDSYIKADNLTNYMINQTLYSITLLDENHNALANKTDSKGVSRINLNLEIGEYEVYIRFDGDNKVLKSDNSSVIFVKPSVITAKNTKFTQNSKFYIKLLNQSGEALVGENVKITIDNKEYFAETSQSGEINFNINLANGRHLIGIFNPQTLDSSLRNIEVTDKISENSDITMYWGANSFYKVRIFDDFGNPQSGGVVTFTISSKTLTAVSDANGYLYLPITLNSGKYTIKAEYCGFEVTNTVVVKSTLITKDKKIKKGKTLKFHAKLLNSNGKVLKGKKIIFKLKNKKYTAKTNKKGIVTIKIKKLKVGKYTITTSFGKLKIKNRIIVKK